MKKFLIVLYSAMSFYLAGQTSKIVVNFDLACGGPFPHEVETKIFELLGGQKILVESTTGNPAIFNNLYPDRPYILEISTTAISSYPISVEDIVQLKKMVLGLTSTSNAMIYGNDTNDSYTASTLDLVLMSRDALDIQQLNNKSWFFISNNDAYNTNIANLSSVINSTYIDKIEGPEKEITFLAFEKYNSRNIIPKECNNCGLEQNHPFDLTIFSQTLTAGSTKTIPINLFGNHKLIKGYRFSLKVKDALIQYVNHDNETLSSISSLMDEVSFLNLGKEFNEGNQHVADINILPNKDGAVLEFFEINYSKPIEILTYEGQCISNSSNLELDNVLDCPIEWPPLVITVPNCTSEYETGKPVFKEECNQFMNAFFTDFPINWPDGSCYKVVRTWQVFNWLTAELTEKHQIIIYKTDYPTVCEQQEIFVPSTGILIEARSLVNSNIQNHLYSFSPDNIADSIRQLQASPPFDHYFTVYDITDSTYCLALVKKNTNCDPSINIHAQISLNNSSGVYIVSASAFDDGNTLFCQGIIDNFAIAQTLDGEYKEILNFSYDQYAGQMLTLHLKYLIDNNWYYFGKVYVKFLSDVVSNSPLEFQCYNDNLVKNETMEITFFSPNFEGIYGFQGAIKVNDATLIKTRNVSLPEIMYNNSNNVSRFLWSDATPRSLSIDDTIFTMTILPTKSGKLSDFISIDDTSLNGEAYLDDLSSVKIDLNFSFVNRTTNTNDMGTSFLIGPNPINGNELNFSLPQEFHGKPFHCFNIQGKVIFSGKIELEKSEGKIKLPENIINGLYVFSFGPPENMVSNKILVLR